MTTAPTAAPSTLDDDAPLPPATDDQASALLVVCGERVGTWAGAVRHYRAAAKLGVAPVVCDACRAANAARAREHYAQPGNAALATQRVTAWRRQRRAAQAASTASVG